MNELKIPTHLETVSLNEQTNYRLIEINKIKEYSEPEIREQREIIRRLSEYVTGLDCDDKILTGFLTIFSGTNIFICSCQNKQKITLDLITSIFSFSSLFNYSNN